MKAYSVILLSFSLLGSVFSQLLTTTNGAGNSVVLQVTTNAFGQSLTQTLQTLAPGGTSTTSPTTAAPTTATPTTVVAPATTTTQQQGQQGPVGAPGTTPETPGGPTPFTYTTTDASGNYVVTTGIFTPTVPATVPYTPTLTGTILPYSVWLSQVGGTTGATAAAQVANSAKSALWPGDNLTLLLRAGSMTLIGVIGGSLVVFL